MMHSGAKVQAPVTRISDIMLNVIILSVIMLGVVVPSF
jgi:hypothetical protein